MLVCGSFQQEFLGIHFHSWFKGQGCFSPVKEMSPCAGCYEVTYSCKQTMSPVIVPCPLSMLAQIATSTEIVMPLTMAFISEVKGRSDKGQSHCRTAFLASLARWYIQMCTENSASLCNFHVKNSDHGYILVLQNPVYLTRSAQFQGVSEVLKLVC